MYRMYHVPRSGKNKGKDVATPYWHKTEEGAEAHKLWWTRTRYEKWYYKKEEPESGIILKDLGNYLCAYTSISPTLQPVKEVVV